MIIVRGYSPLGFYPVKAISHACGAFVLEDDLIFSAVPEHQVTRQQYIAERQWLNPAEIRLLAALALSVPSEWGKVFAYPEVVPIRIELEDDAVLTDKATQQRLKHELIRRTNERKEPDHDPLLHKPIPRAPAFGGYAYRHNENAADLKHQCRVLKVIDLTDNLMIRGLGALLKGQLLQVHQHFHTESCFALYVAMEASMHLIFRRLKGNIKNPGPKDASEYLANAFNSKIVPSRYFAEFYDDRIRTVHPSSRFGTFPYAPLTADDYYMLYAQLRGVYDFLITGRLDPSMEGR